MPGPLHVTPDLQIPEAELRWRFSRSSGPGGQGVNTTDSRVELSFDVTTSTALGPVYRARALERLAGRLVGGTVTVVVSDTRSQVRNRAIAEQRLAELLRRAVAPPPKRRRSTKPSRAARQRRLSAKKQRGATKQLRGRPRGDE